MIYKYCMVMLGSVPLLGMILARIHAEILTEISACYKTLQNGIIVWLYKQLVPSFLDKILPERLSKQFRKIHVKEFPGLKSVFSL